MTWGVTPTGFNRPRLSDIKTEQENVLKTTFGNGINLNPESIFGQLVGIYAEREDLVWQAAQDVYNSQYPDTASGVSLDNVCALTGTKRDGSEQSLVEVLISGVAGTVIPAGKLIAVENNGPQFSFPSSITIPISGSISATAYSVLFGPIAAPAGTLNVIVTPIVGWVSVTNALDAILGSLVETDPELRTKRADQLQKGGSATVEAIRAKLLAVANVTHCIIYENDTLLVDVNGLPAKSFEAFVEGGVALDIATAIWLSKAAGIQSFGDQATNITDSQGLVHVINWSRPVEKLIYCVVNITSNPSLFPLTGAQDVEDLILAYGNDLQVGDPVIVVPQMIASISSVPGILNAVIFIGLAPAPVSSANIIQAINEIAKFDSARVTVNVS